MREICQSGLTRGMVTARAAPSLLYDLVIDTVLMPVDLVLWPLGYTKEKIKGGGP
jgi:hypothetical protein